MDPCLPDLLYASYGGVGFWVDNEDGKYGRRIVSHEYPMRDDPYHEDLGKSVNSWTVKAYLFGHDAVQQKDALVAVCQQRGAKSLVLPADTFMAVCPSISVSRSKDRVGWFDVTMEFKRDSGTAGGPLVSSVLFERALSGLSISTASTFGALFGEAMVVGPVMEFVTSNAVGRIQAFCAEMFSLVQSGPSVNDVVYPLIFPSVEIGAGATNTPAKPLNGAKAADIIADIDGLQAAAFDLMKPPPDQVAGVFCSYKGFQKPDVPYYSPDTAFRDSGAAVALALSVADIMGRAMDLINPVDAIQAASSLINFAPSEAPAISGSISDTADSRNAFLFNALVRVQACIQWARGVAQAPYSLRSEAINARATIVSLLDYQIEQLGTYGEAIKAVMAVRDQCAQMLSAQINGLATLNTVYAPRSMPALYWAARLYADVDRAQGLADLNAAANWNFMPMSFNALSR